MSGFDPLAIYDYLLDRQVADNMGFETVQELYEWQSKQKENKDERISTSTTRI